MKVKKEKSQSEKSIQNKNHTHIIHLEIKKEWKKY